MKVVAALIIFIFLVPYSAAVYKGLGFMFNTVFPSISVNWCMLAIAVLTAVYLVLGGYTASSLTDFIQGIIMVAGIIFMIGALLNTDEVGGLEEGLSRLSQITDNGDGITGAQLTSIWGADSWKFLCTNILLTSLAYGTSADGYQILRCQRGQGYQAGYNSFNTVLLRYRRRRIHSRFLFKTYTRKHTSRGRL